MMLGPPMGDLMVDLIRGRGLSMKGGQSMEGLPQRGFMLARATVVGMVGVPSYCYVAKSHC